MLAFLQILLVFSAVVSFMALFVFHFGGSSAHAPLFIMASSMLYYSIFGCFNKLVLGAWLYFAFAAAAAAFLLIRRKKWQKQVFFTPGMVFFLAGSIAFMVLYAIRQPIFTEWDEFSFWGIAPKVVTTTGQMYSAIKSSMRAVTFTPGLVVLGYMFQFFGAFAPWKVFCAYNTFFFAVFAAVLAPFSKKGNTLHAAPFAALCFLTPYLCTEYLRLIYVSNVYRSSLSDIPLGIVFGAGLAAYFAAEEKNGKTLLLVVLSLACEALVKDMGFALALIGAALVAFDYLFIEDGLAAFAAAAQKNFGPIVKKATWCLGLFSAPVVAFWAWGKHMQLFLNLNRGEIGGEQEMGMFQMVFTGIKELFSNARSEKFTAVFNAMVEAFFNADITLLGSGFCMVTAIGFVLLLAYIASGKKGRARVLAFSLFSSLGFLAFYIFTGFTYVYVFKGADGTGLVSYNRYIYPYYIGWLLAALAILAAALFAATGPKSYENASQKRAGWAGLTAPLFYTFGIGVYAFIFHKALSGVRFTALARFAVPYYAVFLTVCAAVLFAGEILPKLPQNQREKLPAPLLWRPGTAVVKACCHGFFLVFCAACIFRWQACVKPELSFINYPASHEAGFHTQAAKVEKDIAAIPADATTFFVWQGDDGLQWFINCYMFFPKTLEYSFGGGTLGLPGTGAPIALTQEELCTYIEEHGCSYIYLANIDGTFIESYAALFTDALAMNATNAVRLYKVETGENGMQFAPMESGGSV